MSLSPDISKRLEPSFFQKIFIALSLTISLSSHSLERVYSPQLKSDATSGVRFSVPYSAGVHKGTASRVDGSVILDENDQLLKAHFEVPIGTLSTANATRDCHMREALGIDYTNSKFPNEHVCDSDNKTPSDGPDSIVYPLVILDFTQFEKAPATPFQEGIAAESVLKVVIQIHGLSKEIKALPVKIQKITTPEGVSTFRITAKMTVSLKDFAITVKPFTFGPIKIGVDDKVTVDLDLLISQLPEQKP